MVNNQLPTAEQGGAWQKQANRVAAVAAITGITALGAVSAFANRGRAVSAKTPKPIGNLYTSLEPQNILAMLQTDMAPGEDLVISSSRLVHDSFVAQGDCADGSSFMSWSDSDTARDKVDCSGTRETEPVVSASTTPNFRDLEIAKVGKLMVLSIPGQSIDFMQKGKTLTSTLAGSKATFSCPNPNLKYPSPPIKSVRVGDGHRATLTYCPTPRRVVHISPVDITSGKFAKAFEDISEDPIRTQEWGGDNYNKDMFIECPTEPFQYSPNLTFTVSSKKGVRTSYHSLPTQKYCDRVGQYSTEVSAEVNHKQVGSSVLHLDGLREVLTFGSDILFSSKDSDVAVILPGTEKLCLTSPRHAQMRVKLIERFKAMKSQQFVHSGGGYTDTMRSKMRVVYSQPRTIC